MNIKAKMAIPSLSYEPATDLLINAGEIVSNTCFIIIVTTSKNLKRVMVRDGICVSNSYYVVFYPTLALKPSFIQIGRKTQKLKIFNNLVGFGWLGY